jgi:hypothetical protein
MRSFRVPALIGAAFLALFVVKPVDFAPGQSLLETNLPKNWIGEFRWGGSPEVQRYEITVLNTKPLTGSRIEASGCGRVTTPQQVTDIDIRMVIDEGSLAVQIFESEPNRRSFTIDGSHRGSMSQDLKLIAAEWETLGTGQRGVLQLRAGGALACPTI